MDKRITALLYGCALGSSHDFDGDECHECGMPVEDYDTALEALAMTLGKELDKARRFKGWRVVGTARNKKWAVSPLLVKADAIDMRETWKASYDVSDARVVRVYRKAKS